MFRRDVLTAMPAWVAPLLASGRAVAQTRAETLLIAVEAGQNSLDPQGLGVNPSTLGVTWMLYDRLVAFGAKDLVDGGRSDDFNRIVPELAESWSVASDGLSITFTLRDDAVFHDGAPVTAADVKWSLDRAVANPAPASQMRAGGFERAEQFVVIDPRTVRVELGSRNALALPGLAVIQPSVLNAALCRRHATAEDPWAQAWVKTNAAGGGAYRLDTWTPRLETVLIRNENWRSGPLPAFRQVVIREVPSTGNRRALLLRGDADLAPDLPVRDVVDLAREPKLRALGGPMANTMYFVGMNTRTPPFDDVRVRQAIASAIPYDRILNNARLGRGQPLWGGPPRPGMGAEGLAWPQAFPYRTNPARAQALLQSAGLDGGFETTLSYDLGTASIDHPVALLMQEALREIGVSAAIDRRPAGEVRGLIERRELPFFLFQFGTWFDQVEYFFSQMYQGSKTAPGNGAAYASPEMDRLIAVAQGSADDNERNAARRRMIALAMQDVPYVPIVQPYLNVVAQKSVTGYVTMFHRQVDARVLART